MRGYIEARSFFQKNRERLSKEQLKELLGKVSSLKKDALFRDEKNEILDLEIDIEDALDKVLENVRNEKQEQVVVSEDDLRTHSLLMIEKLTECNHVMLEIVDFEVEGLLMDAEKYLIGKTLVHFDGNRTKTAKSLGISVRTLRNKLNEYLNNYTRGE